MMLEMIPVCTGIPLPFPPRGAGRRWMCCNCREQLYVDEVYYFGDHIYCLSCVPDKED